VVGGEGGGGGGGGGGHYRPRSGMRTERRGKAHVRESHDLIEKEQESMGTIPLGAGTKKELWEKAEPHGDKKSGKGDRAGMLKGTRNTG